MIFMLINFIFNGFLLGVVYIMGYALLYSSDKHLAAHPPEWIFWSAGFTTVGLLIAFGISPLGIYLFRLFIGARKAVGRERNKIDPLLNEVLLNYNSKKGSNLTAAKLHILIKDSKEPNAQAFGTDTIIFTDGLLKSCSDDEIKAVIAHELGHLHYKHGIKLIAVIFGSFGAKIVMWLYSIYIVIATIIDTVFSKRDGGDLMSLMAYVPIIFFFTVIALNWIFTILFNLTLRFAVRNNEYQADKFAAELGYKTQLISFLEKAHDMAEHGNSFLGKIIATHPVPMKRIGTLEDKN